MYYTGPLSNELLAGVFVQDQRPILSELLFASNDAVVCELLKKMKATQ